ncbi:hypothetical protein KC333_g4400 [Hortaea werneckii]|nr:hypothetical protein KC333_g4400 [Hortaea werneckii]
MRAQSAGLSATFNKLFFGTSDWPSVKLRAASAVVIFFGAAHGTSDDLHFTASIHATDLLFNLYPAPRTTYNVSATNFLHSTAVIWAVHFLVHWATDLSSPSLLHPINFFILHLAANFSSASTLYRINFFIVHWTANSPSVYHLHPANLFVVHRAAHWPAFLVNRAPNRPSFILPSWILPSIFLPYRPTDYSDNRHLQYNRVPKPVGILHTLATTVRLTPTHHRHCDSILPFATHHLRAPLGNSERVNWDLIEISIANSTTPKCYPFDEAVLSFAYFIYGPKLAEDECEMEFYESDDCTDLVTLGVDLAKYSARCYNFGRTTRSLKVSCGGGPGSHY